MKKNHKILAISVLTSLLIWGCCTEDDGIPTDITFPTLAFVTDTTVNEGDQDEILSLTLTLTGENKTNAMISYAAIAGSAIDDADFKVIGGGQVVFAAGETTKTVQITIVGDEVKEAKEGFEVKFYNPMNCKLSADFVKVTVEDDDNASATGVAIPTGGTTSPNSYPGMNLIWADEFNSANLNMANWSFENGDGDGWGNNELQHYRPENTSLVEGNLVITARKQNYGTSNYTSSRLVTKNKKQFKYGRIDIRAALPGTQGLWPALWMLGTNLDAVSWPSCGEIDIMEHAGDKPTKVTSAVHYGTTVANHQYKTQVKFLSGGSNFHDEYHVFSLNWQQDFIEFLVDDEVYHTITPASLDGAAYPFNNPMFFIFNVAVGGNYPGNPDNTTAFPQHMIVDYVRVFQ